MFDKIKTFLREWWNFYLPIIISYLTSSIIKWNANQMMTINQYISMTISITCFLTLLKHVVFPNRKKILVDKIVMAQRNIKNVNKVINLDDEVEIKKTKKGMDKIMRFIKTYKGAITSAIIAIATVVLEIVDTLTGFMNGIFVVNGIDVLTLTGLIASTIIGIVSYGFGSPKLKEQIAKIKDQLDGDNTEQVQYISDVKYLQGEIVNLEKEISKLKLKNSEVIEKYERCKRLGILIPDDVKIEYTDYIAKLQDKQNALEVYKMKLAELQQN